MIVLNEFDFSEKRSHPDLNPKLSAYKILKPYSEDPNIFISFTEIDKIGINPQSRYDTPLGIYAYPLKAIWKEYNIDRTQSIGQSVPFAGEHPFIWVLQVVDKSHFVKDMSMYAKAKYDKDMIKLRKYIHSEVRNEDDSKKIIECIRDAIDMYPTDFAKLIVVRETKGYEEAVNQAIDLLIDYAMGTAIFKSNIGFMWNITRITSLVLSLYKKRHKVAVFWNFILREVLGYSGFADIKGKKYIHSNEPIQAVFLSTKAFKVVTKVLNKDYKRIDNTWISKAKIVNATFTVSDKDPNYIKWDDGTWKNGTWEFGTWYTGIWERGTWENGTWENGTWENGTWKNGTWEFGTWYTGIWERGTWKNGTWKNGTWEFGTWYTGAWGRGAWKNGTWEDGTWYTGTWERGTWKNGTWEDGTWKNGIWKNGIWKNGIWEDGTWVNGTWFDGIWKRGKIYNPLTKSVESSTVDPATFYKNIGYSK